MIIRRLFGILVLAAGLYVAPGLVAAQTAPTAKIEKVRELFLATHTEALKRGLHSWATIVVTMGLAGADPPPPGEEVFRIMGDEVDRAVDRELPKLADQVAAVYADAFTEAEIDAFLGSHESPAGQSMLAKMPAVRAETNRLSKAWAESLMSSLIEPIHQRFREKGYVQ